MRFKSPFNIANMATLAVVCAILLMDSARAEAVHLQFSQSTSQTLINCCFILGLSMIVSAIILKKWK